MSWHILRFFPNAWFGIPPREIWGLTLATPAFLLLKLARLAINIGRPANEIGFE